MKKLFLLIPAMISTIAYSQVGINTTSPDPSSVLDIKSSNKGLLIPRVALTGKKDITTIPNPANSLLIYNVSNAGTAPDNVVADNIYKFTVSSGKWEKLLDENTVIPGAVGMSNILGFKKTGNDNSYLGPDIGLGANIRVVKFDNIGSASSYATYDTATNELTILKTGYFTFNINLVVVGPFTGSPRLGVSKPYTGTINGALGNSLFAFLSQPTVNVTSNMLPVTLFSSGTLLLNAGTKVAFLTRFIDPSTNSINVESINYDRTMVNSVTIVYTTP